MSTDTGTASATEVTRPAIRRLFEPIRIGPLVARSRVMMPPHSSAIGNLWGTEAEAEQNLAYFRQRAEAGIAWATIPGRISNVLNAGFEPSGISAVVHGAFRGANYVERVRRFTDTMHAAGALAATQLTMNGGYPHAPSARFSGPVNFLAPHVLNVAEIAELVEEYRFSASTAREAGIDIFELHMNHEDLTQQFLSPLTNVREDEYGGDLDGRLRFALEVLQTVRDTVGRDRVLGVRMNLLEPDERGYSVDDGIEIARRIEATGLVDYFHMVMGTTWGNPSYIQPHFFEPGEWAAVARRYKDALTLPIIHTGLIDSPRRAEEIVSAGDADMVGMARAHIADGDLLLKARNGQEDSIRPCVGVNDCINRRYVDGLPFGCAVNPHTGRELDGPWGSTARARPLIVVGGGPAGLELAALASEAGASVTLYERDDALGGQLRTAALAPSFGRYDDYLDWQRRRLDRLGVELRVGEEFTAATLDGADSAAVVAFATGADERTPDIPGVDSSHVLLSRDVLHGRRQVGKSVALIVQDDHMAPLAVAETLAAGGSDVVVFYSTPVPAQLLGRYSIGSVLGRLDSLGVTIRIMEEVVRIGQDSVTVRNVYSRRERVVDGFDSVVLACGGVSDSRLFDLARAGSRIESHILGDAYAPRRLVFATRQALALAELLGERKP